MSLENSTLSDFRAIELNTFALDILRESSSNAGRKLPEISLSSLSFGILTILFLASVYFLICGGSAAAHVSIRILLLSTLLLYVSTATYMATILWVWSSWDHLMSRAADGLLSTSYDGQNDLATYDRALQQQSWILTIVMSLNFMIGDAIVWWRACVIWQHKAVNWAGPLLVALTTGNPYSQASVISTVVTNALATSLIAYKAWEHRQLWKHHFAGAGAASQVLKALALLIESGCIYCGILIFVTVYVADPTTSQAGPNFEFSVIAFYFTYGCLVPLVAIYPTVIVVLVALKQSPIDNAGLSRVCEARRSGPVEGSMSNTIVFHHATFRTSIFVELDLEGSGGGMLPDDRQSERSLETSMGTGLEVKDVGNLA